MTASCFCFPTRAAQHSTHTPTPNIRKPFVAGQSRDAAMMERDRKEEEEEEEEELEEVKDEEMSVSDNKESFKPYLLPGQHPEYLGNSSRPAHQRNQHLLRPRTPEPRAQAATNNLSKFKTMSSLVAKADLKPSECLSGVALDNTVMAEAQEMDTDEEIVAVPAEIEEEAWCGIMENDNVDNETPRLFQRRSTSNKDLEKMTAKT
ncbi:hypothetical protein B7494_g2294 [Chlorociboria aeruginascens]|nr:hypothetical protein B7494_g2294 [Chlorociboria aeruginascens]